MKMWKFSAAVGAISALCASNHAGADFSGLAYSVEPSGGFAPPAGGPRVIVHLYAEFTSSDDRVNAWGGGPGFGLANIRNVLTNGTTLGSGFTQFGGVAGQVAPYSANTDRDWDTYMTIGVRYGNEAPGGLDATQQIPQTPAFITGPIWIAPANGGGAYITPDDPQGRADYRVTGNDNDHRVLLAQLVINAGELIKGTIGVAWSVDGVSGSGSIVSGLTLPLIPTHGGLALLAFAGLSGTRRRRDGGSASQR